jgi:uncharacterized protein (DUF1501 family)
MLVLINRAQAGLMEEEGLLEAIRKKMAVPEEVDSIRMAGRISIPTSSMGVIRTLSEAPAISMEVQEEAAACTRLMMEVLAVEVRDKVLAAAVVDTVAVAVEVAQMMVAAEEEVPFLPHLP